ncbi:LytR family transcriptional regulator [Rhodococcus oryzae]|uniref:LytR family transcriptional regulator n=1 Tax=Rhodococcus oryzae TaxID=2571143 RepID=A0ABY2RD33_9NOCA|nr:LytR family transcriptional regulator [Rhodococcus oryzae]
MIRRDGRRAEPTQGARAWSQAPEPSPQHGVRPGATEPTRAHRPQGGSPYAPPQKPEPYADPYRRQADRVGPPVQPPRRTGPAAPPPQPPRPAKTRRKANWGRRIGLVLAALLVLVGGSVVYLDRGLNRIDALADYPGRIGDTPGTNWLLVGSDSRTGLTPEQEQELATGGELDSKRTDTIIIVHIPKSGKSTMVSIPRDSYVTIPGWGKDKINSSFSGEDGGPQLLVQTVEEATGLRMDHYVEIGFGGFAGIVDALGGINICVPYPIDDPLAGINLQPGCQDLTGAQALGFVRTRATPLADLDRMKNQRAFMSALLDKSTSIGTLINPFRLWPMATKTAESVQVDEDDHLWNLAGLAWAMRGGPIATTVPIAGFEDVDAGNVLIWDRERASEFFGALAEDRPIPESLITTGP